MNTSEPWGAFSPGDEDDEEIIFWMKDETDETIVAQRGFSTESIKELIDVLLGLIG